MSLTLRRSRPRRKSRWPVWAGIASVLVILAVVRSATIEPRQSRPYLETGKLPLVLAHQGASGYAPSNTLEAFKLGLDQGADILELDVHMTKDGIIVVSHDETIDRMSSGKGHIKSMTLAELRQYDFGDKFTPDGGATFPYKGKGVTIPTLEEVFQAFPGVRVNIEIKQEEPAMEERLWELVRQFKMEEKVMISSFHSGPDKRWTALAGEATAMAANTGHMYEFVAYYLLRLTWLYQPKVDSFQLPTHEKVGPFTIRFDTKRLINTAHGLGIRVHYWTINDEETMRHLVSIGADGIITDFPDRAVKVLKEAGTR